MIADFFDGSTSETALARASLPPRPAPMTRSPIALALVAALGVGTVLPSAPVLAQAAGASMTVSPIRTGSSSIGGPFGVRLSVYDARSFELFWNRIPNAATYRVQVGSRTVQENGATSRFVGGVDVSGGFDYTLTALDRAGTALATQRFRVQPASSTQLVAAGGGTSAPTTPSTPANPATPTAPTTPPAAASTARPTNLRLTVYSPTAAELFWQPGTFVDRNEIRRDGVLIATLGGGGVSSYFDNTRQPGRSYTYEVRAIDGAGPASATIGGTGGAPTTPTNPMAPVAPPAAGGPIRTGASTIAGDIPVRLAVYDARSFELFWERVSGAATYRLSRDGQVVQESNGLSRFVTGVNGQASFAYTLVALDRSGNAIRSTRFTVSPSAGTQLALGGSGTAPTSPANPTTPGAPPAGTASLLDPLGSGSPLSGDNYLAFLPAFYRVVNAAPLEEAYARILPIADELRAALDGEANDFVAESAGADGTTFACPEGGRARVFPEPSRQAGQTTIAFDACRVDGATLDGAVFENRSPSLAVFDTVGRSAPGTTLTYTSADGTRLVIQGRRFESTPDPAGSGNARRSLEWSANWTLRSGARELTVQDQTTFLTDPGPSLGDEFRTRLSMRGNLTLGRTIDIVTLNPLRASEATGRYVEGQVLLRDASGGQLNLSVTEGGGNEVRVRFDTAGRVGERLVAQGDGSNMGFRRLGP